MTRRDVQHTPDRISLKLAAGDLIDAVGGATKAAGYCRADQRRLSDYANPNTDAFMPSDVKIDLEKRARCTVGFPQLTREEVLQLGFVLIKLPQGRVARADLLGSIARLGKEAADVSAEICTALADDNKVDAVEAARVRIQVAEAQAVLATLDGQLNAIIRGEE